MADVGLKILLEAEVGSAVKQIQTVVTAMEQLPAAATSAAKGVDKFTTAVSKAETPVFDLDKAIKEATARIHDNIDKMADDAIKSGDKLEASIGPAITSFNKLKASAGSAANVFNGSSVAGFVKPLNVITPAAAKAAISLDKLGKSGSGASTTLINAGRILSDSPYGFIGIANNIEPLLESFRRLQAETGSTKNAFKSLLSGLAGGGGVGLAFSAAIAAVQFLSIGFDRWTGSTKKAGDALKDTKEEVKAFADSVATDIVKVNTLAAIIDSGNRSYKDRKDALTELRKLYPEYLKGLTDEEALTKGVQGAVDLLTKSMIRRGIIASQQDKINKAIGEALEAAKKEQEQFATSVGETDEALKKSTSTTTKYLTKQEQVAAQYKAFVDNVTATKAPTQFIFNKVQATIKPLIDELLKFGGTTDEILGKFDKQVKEKVIKPLKEAKIHIRSLLNLDQNDLSGSLENNRLIIEAAIKFKPAQAKKEAEELVKFVNTPGVVPPITLRMDADIALLLSKLEIARKAAEKFNEDVSNALKSAIVNAATGIADAIAGAIAGKGNIFAGLLQVVASAMKQFGEAMIALGTGVLIAKTALKTNPAAAIAAGFVLSLAGAALQAAIPKFAAGGIVTGPTIGMIGEAGPEVVFPLNKLDSFLSDRNGGQQVVVMDVIMRGQDALLRQRRAEASFKRTNG